MAFKGITFAGQNVTPKNDGGLYQAHYGDGILWGCSMAISGDDLVIQSGEFIAGGRVCFVDGATSVDLSGRLNNTGYIQVIMNYDLTQGEGSQWYTTFVESATTTFPALTQDDINDTDTLYQVELAVVQISGGNLTSIYSTMLHSSLILSNENGIIGKVGYNGSELDFCMTDPAGDPLTGMFSNGDDTIVYANNQNIVFRPVGRNDNTNQVSLSSTTGALSGGWVEYKSDINTTASSITSGWQYLSSVTIGEGLYIMEGQYTFKSNTAGAIFGCQIALNGSTTDYSTARAALNVSNTADTYGLNVYGLINSTGSQAYQLLTYASSAHTRYSYVFKVYRIG